MFESINRFFKKIFKVESKEKNSGKEAKERLHLVLMQDRANVSADFLEMMKQEIIEVIKKYIDVDENSIDVRLTNQTNNDGSNGAPALYANIPIINIKEKDENKSTSNNVGVDAHGDPATNNENKSTSNNVEIDAHGDPKEKEISNKEIANNEENISEEIKTISENESNNTNKDVNLEKAEKLNEEDLNDVVAYKQDDSDKPKE